ncbi:MAG TPA: hypothetical protein VIJ14_07895 [Rhabdochlamydiaceae bacterium]
MLNLKLKSAQWSKGLTYGQCYSFLRWLVVITFIAAMLVFGSSLFAHVHIEIDVPEGTWEAIEKHDQKQAYEKSQDPVKRDDMSDKEKVEALKYEWENKG